MLPQTQDSIQKPKAAWLESEKTLRGLLLLLGLLGEFVSGYATDIGVQTYFFPRPWSLVMTVFIQGCIIFSAVALKAAISRQAFSKAWRLPFVGLLLLSFSISVSLSAVGAYKEFGFKFTQTSGLLSQEKSDFNSNWTQLDELRQTDIGILNQKIGELNRLKATQDAAAHNPRSRPQTRNSASVKSAQLATQIKQLEELSGEFEVVVVASFDETGNQTAADSVADTRAQKQKLEAARQTLVNLHGRLPEELRRDREFPAWQSSTAPPTNEQSAFVADLRAGKTPALTAFGFGLFLDLMCVFCAFAGVNFPTSAERISRARVWLRSVRQAFGAGTSTIDFIARERGGMRVAANFKHAAENLTGADVEQARPGLESIFSNRINQHVTIRSFLNADGAALIPQRALLPQLGATRSVFIVFNEDEDELFPDVDEVGL
jgi:hypothetical protein